MHMATVPLTLHGCCFLISWLIHTFIFLLLSTHCNGTQISTVLQLSQSQQQPPLSLPPYHSFPSKMVTMMVGIEYSIQTHLNTLQINTTFCRFTPRTSIQLMLKVSSNLRGICTSTTRTILDTVGLMVIHSSRL